MKYERMIGTVIGTEDHGMHDQRVRPLWRWNLPSGGLLCLAAALVAAAVGRGASAQLCGAPLDAVLGSNPVQVGPTVPGTNVNLAGICDLSQASIDTIFNARWHRFVPPASGRYVATTCGSISFDSKMAVSTSCTNLSASTVLGCNDDGGTGCTVVPGGQPRASRVEFEATQGVPCFIAIGGFSTTTAGSGTFRIEAAGPPPSGCGSAPVAVVGNNPFDSTGSTESLDLTETCNPGPAGDDVMRRVVWFRWTAPAQPTVAEVSTCGSASFDTRLAVFTACGDPASIITCGDDTSGCPDFTTRLRFETLPGQQYRIAVGGFDAASAGAGTLKIAVNVNENAACGLAPNDCCEPSPDDTSHCSNAQCCEIVCAVDPFCCAGSGDGWWDETCAEFARLACASCGGATCELPSGATEEPGACDTEVDLNSGCAGGEPGPVMPIVDGQVRAGRLWAAEGARDTDWYEFEVAEQRTCTFTLRSSGPVQAFIADDACPDYSVRASTTVGAFACPAVVSRCLVPGRYRIVVAMSVFDGFPNPCSETERRVRYTIAMSSEPCDAQYPPNDACAAAAPVPSAGDARAFDTRLATDSEAVLSPACDEGNGTNFVCDLWYAWRPAAGLVRVTTCGTAGFDTRIAVYGGCSLGAPPVACNDDAAQCGGLTSEVDFAADGTTTYLVRVGGYEGTGRGVVRFVPMSSPTNDECAQALEVSDGRRFFTTASATASPIPVPASCEEGFGTAITSDVWFRYVAPRAGTATFSACDLLSFDPRMVAYSTCGQEIPLACNDDAPGCGDFGSRISIPVFAGQQVLLRLGGLESRGEGILDVVTGCEGDLNGDGSVNGLDLGVILGGWGQAGASDLNEDGVTNGLDLGILLGAWGPCD